ncbi:hypothetical protein G4B88_009995 [Cannabis sativa]|uniref:RNase H type-1 domain-containing protein n=1 Tax=Cannabis sativa TaxID=3483 RepID=A0A7J6DLX2_CANSA|nr:hypothetical protein G4B88_009995 [Cannabis sativa]
MDRPWVTCLNEKYCKKESFWSTSARASDSTFWKGILNSRDIIRKGCMTLVRPRFLNLRSVADKTNDNGSWNIELLKEMFGETLGNRIGAIKRLPHDQNDSLVWKEAADGTFTVKRGCIATHGPFPMCFGEGSGDSPKRRLSWILSSLPTELVDRVFTFIGCLFEGIWNARNEFLFKGKRVNIEIVRCCILRRYAECLILANADLDMGQSITAEVPRGAIGSNGQAFCVTDASWKDGVAGLAVGVLERQSNTSWWFARNATASSAAEAELLAIQWALQIAGQREFKWFACASDAKVLVSALNERKFPPMWTLKPLALEVLNLCNL